MNHPLIEVKNVGKEFLLGDTLVRALINVSFQVQQGGKMIALMGPSGSGKSTLLNLLGALDQPSSGQVLVDGVNLSQLNADQQAEFRNKSIGFIFQNFNLIPILTPLENVLLPWQLSLNKSKLQSSELMQQRAKELLNKVGLTKQADQKVNQLSGGQMQRVAIARALINQPTIVLADEPTANLDHNTADVVLDILRKLCNEEGVTVVMATHDHSVLKFCDRIISLRDGSLIKDEWK